MYFLLLILKKKAAEVSKEDNMLKADCHNF